MIGAFVTVVGIAAGVLAWRRVATGAASLWRTMPGLYAALGIVAALVVGIADDPRSFGEPFWSLGVAGDVGFGAVLAIVLWGLSHVGTRILTRWGAFDRSLRVDEARRVEVALGIALSSSIVVAVGEELFWRGLVQAGLGPWLDDRGVVAAFVVAAIAVWVMFCLVVLPSRSLPLLAGAVVPGAVWAALPLATGRIVASLVCHVGWTVLIVAFPPTARGRMMTA